VCRVGYIYAFRFGDSNEFKLGVTVDLKRRRREHQGSNARVLTLFDSIEHADYKDGEKHLKKLLAAHRLPGGEETFGLPDEELRAAMTAVRLYMDEELPLQRRVADYAKLESSDEMLAANDRMREAFERLQAIRREHDLLQPEADRLAAEQAKLSERYDTLDEEEKRLRTLVMDQIGLAWLRTRPAGRAFVPGPPTGPGFDANAIS
jgi:hypothetical protein